MYEDEPKLGKLYLVVGCGAEASLVIPALRELDKDPQSRIYVVGHDAAHNIKPDTNPRPAGWYAKSNTRCAKLNPPHPAVRNYCHMHAGSSPIDSGSLCLYYGWLENFVVEPFIRDWITKMTELRVVRAVGNCDHWNYCRSVIEDVFSFDDEGAGVHRQSVYMGDQSWQWEYKTKGIVFHHGVHLGDRVELGNFCLLNTRCIIEHDCTLEDGVFVGPGAILCGNVSVGRNSFIGAGATIVPNVKIGEGCFVKAGTVVKKDMKAGERR